jgi:UDP-glucose 4-epimerase
MASRDRQNGKRTPAARALVTQASSPGEGPRRALPDARVVAVTGSRGFLGAEVLRRLDEDRRYERLIALDLKPPAQPLDKLRFFRADLTLPTAATDLATVLDTEQVDTVVHAAFLARPTRAVDWAHELEDLGTMHVLQACARARVRKVILASTTLVYGPHPENPNFLPETAPQRGLEHVRWLADKVSAEAQLAAFAERVPGAIATSLRAAPTLGPRVQNLVTRFFSWPIVPVVAGADPLLQFVHEEDLIDAFKLVIDDDHPGAFNIVGDGVLPYATVRALLGRLPLYLPARALGVIGGALWSAQLGAIPPGLAAYLRYLCVADGAKARHRLGFAPRWDIRAIIDDFLGEPSAAAVEAGRLA